MKTFYRNYLYPLLVLVLFVGFMVFLKPALASSENINCSDRYVTLVNPVRARNLWLDKSLQPVKDQYGLIAGNNLPATWLLQYDVLFDPDLLQQIKQFNNQQEKGIFLEISPILAEKARVIYPSNIPWFSPHAIFLSGYTQSERRRLIDEMFNEFKHEFPPTKIMWIPDIEGRHRDMMATTAEYLRVWEMQEETNTFKEHKIL